MNPTTAQARHVAARDLHDLCGSLVEQLGIGGAQVAVSLGDDLSVASAGTADARLHVPVTDDTLFQIGSTTKVYTAALVMQLADEGRLDLDASVSTYLPEVVLAPGEQWRAITPRQLMAMTSGLDNGPYADTGRSDDAVARYVALLHEIPLCFAPGTSYGYSNASTVVSGLLVERLTGLCWDEALRDRLLAPAGLVESVSLFEDLPYFRTAVGHGAGAADGWAIPQRWCVSRGCGPAGSSLATTVGDLARFGQVFLGRGLAPNGRRVLSETAVAMMQARQVAVPARVFADSWCVGPYTKTWGGVQVFGHSGTTQHGSSLLLWVPEAHAVVATLVNTPHKGYAFADAVTDVVFREWLGVAKPKRPRAGSYPLRESGRYVGTYFAHEVTYQVQERGAELELVVASTGPLTGDSTVTTLLQPIAENRFLPADDAVTGHHSWDIAFSLDEDGRVALLHNGAFAARRVG